VGSKGIICPLSGHEERGINRPQRNVDRWKGSGTNLMGGQGRKGWGPFGGGVLGWVKKEEKNRPKKNKKKKTKGKKLTRRCHWEHGKRGPRIKRNPGPGKQGKNAAKVTRQILHEGIRRKGNSAGGSTAASLRVGQTKAQQKENTAVKELKGQE